jgi:hypothetical protein
VSSKARVEAFEWCFSKACRRGEPLAAILSLVDVVTVPYVRDARITPREV